MNPYHAQVESACHAALVLGPARFLWFGRLVSTDPLLAAERRTTTPGARRGYLLASLRQTLYANFYCQGVATPARRHSAARSRAGATGFVEQLSAANASEGCCEDGWVVRQTAGRYGDAVLLAREGRDLMVRALPGEYLAPRGMDPSAGAPVRLHLPKEYPGLAPGYYMAAGDTPLPRESAQQFLRLYWHVTPRGAVRLVRAATTLLNAAGIPFRLKVLDDPTAYTRCDAAVLYVYEYDWDVLAGLLTRLYAELALELMPTVPAFAKALGPGLGLAEDPPREMSFGLHRCELVADALIRAYERGDSAPEARAQAVRERFAAEGFRPEAPYLNPESSDTYMAVVRPVAAGCRQPDAAPREGAGQSGVPVGWLDVAAGIGRRLVRGALWHSGRCNWVGPLPEDAARPPSAYTLPSGASLACTALGPDLYAGTSGVAFFLAGLAAATNDAGAGRTAAAAIRQALDRAEVVPHELRKGLYAGWTGIALAASQVGLLLDREDLLRGAGDLLRRLFNERAAGTAAPRAHDLISGGAGAIVALVALAKLLSEPALLEHAAELGDDLVRAARVSDEGYSWAAPDRPRQRPLTGLAHGAAGIGCALLELASATERQDYRHAAEMAFRYERGCFDAAAGNWPDFRDVPAGGPRTRRTGQLMTLPYAVGWCHGAPGIALSRLRAYVLLGRDAYRNEALIALGTTARVVRSMLAGRLDDFTPCHGLAGCAEILLDGSSALGQALADVPVLVEEVAARGAARYAAPGAAWPCGLVNGEAPGLMRGLAGIGHFYLRLSNPDVPSVLLPLSLHERFPSAARRQV